MVAKFQHKPLGVDRVQKLEENVQHPIINIYKLVVGILTTSGNSETDAVVRTFLKHFKGLYIFHTF